jgi:hypothetical protein
MVGTMRRFVLPAWQWPILARRRDFGESAGELSTATPARSQKLRQNKAL